MDNNLISEFRNIQPLPPVSRVNDYKREYDLADGIMSIVAILLGRYFIKISYLYSREFMMYFPLYTMAYILAVAFYARLKGVKLNRESYIWAAVMIISARIIRTTTFFRLVMTTLTAVYFTLCASASLTDKGTGRYITVDLYNGFIAHPLGNFFSVFPAFFSLFKRAEVKEKKDKKQLFQVFAGLIIAGFALMVIMPLLISADNNFRRTLNRIFGLFTHDMFGNIRLGLFVFNAVVTLPVVRYIYGLLYTSFGGKNPAKVNREGAEKSRQSAQISPALTLNIAIRAVCGVYVMFMLMQTNYLFGAFSGRLYPGLTYSEYAVNGFWELWWVCIINLCILALSNLFVKDREKQKTKAFRIVLCLLSVLLLATAAAKMGMYIFAYGLTAKRIISSAVLLWLIIVFCLCIADEKQPFNLIKACVYSGLVIYCVVLCADTKSLSNAFNYAFGYDKNEVHNSVYRTPVLPRSTQLKYIDILDRNGDTLAFFDYYDIINDVITNLETARFVNESVNDTPVNTDYYTICFVFDDGSLLSDPHGSIAYFYEKNGHYYLEQPYTGIFRLGDTQGAVIMGYIAPGNVTSVDEKQYVDSYGKLIFYQYVNDEYAYLENFDRVYVPYCVVNRKYFGKELGYCDIPAGDYSGRARDIIYKFEEYPTDQWIIVYSPYDNIGMLYREISATGAPYGLISEYRWNN